ncbi:hypothetical protein [Priestia megaterium]|uniref:hypothetical protein n=1 Tax=Priestia megaterium TaxID=1404 RepID=UPI003CEB526C
MLKYVIEFKLLAILSVQQMRGYGWTVLGESVDSSSVASSAFLYVLFYARFYSFVVLLALLRNA